MGRPQSPLGCTEFNVKEVNERLGTLLKLWPVTKIKILILHFLIYYYRIGIFFFVSLSFLRIHGM